MSKYLSLAVIVFAAACGGAETPAKKSPSPQMAAGNDVHSTCVQAFQRQRECTNEFIPALVAARVRLNAPPGIADKDKELGRDKLVAMALEEWKTDSTDEAIEQTCSNMEAKMPPEKQQQVSDQVRQCLAAEACTAFVDCLIPVIESGLH